MGGFWAEYFDWRWLFYSNIILSAIIAAFVYAFLYGRSHIKRMKRFDVVGGLILTILVVGTQTILKQGNDFNWFGAPFLLLIGRSYHLSLPFHILGNGRTPSLIFVSLRIEIMPSPWAVRLWGF
jgi:DHA2 family multidrug resistance protein